MSDEEKEALEILNNTEWDGFMITIKNLIEKQSKEIEELKEKNEPQPDCTEPVERAEEMVNMTWVNYHYISKEEYENAIKTTFKVCNKHWEDKIKAKIEEVHYKMIGHQDLREAVKQVLNSLLKKEN